MFAGLSFLPVFSLCLDDEAKHFALSRPYHSSCSFDGVQEPKATLSVGVITMGSSQSLPNDRTAGVSSSNCTVTKR